MCHQDFGTLPCLGALPLGSEVSGLVTLPRCDLSVQPATALAPVSVYIHVSIAIYVPYAHIPSDTWTYHQDFKNPKLSLPETSCSSHMGSTSERPAQALQPTLQNYAFRRAVKVSSHLPLRSPACGPACGMLKLCAGWQHGKRAS